MSAKPFIIIFLGVCLVGFVVAVAAERPIVGKLRYRMTVEIETPEGLKTASVVREIVTRLDPEMGHTPYPYYPTLRVRGEAIPIDLGKRGIVFAVMKSSVFDYNYRSAVFFFTMGMVDEYAKPDVVEKYDQIKMSSTALGLGLYPMFVRFADIKNPQSVEDVYDVGVCQQELVKGSCESNVGASNLKNINSRAYVRDDHFEEYFGHGVRLKQVTIQTTAEPVTWQIENILPWLHKYEKLSLNGTIGTNAKALWLQGSEFIDGEDLR